MTAPPIRPTTPLSRYLVLAASFLVLMVFLTLFFLTEQTADYFAWTINPPLTALFIASGYGASFVLELMAFRQRTWAEASIAIYGVIAFSFLTLVATVLHRDRFHFDDPTFITAAGTWVWLGIYASVPLLMSVAVLDQWQTQGDPPPVRAPISRPLRLGLLTHNLLGIQVGILLFITPQQMAIVWPWALTPLTGRAVAAWLIGLSVTLMVGVWGGDWERLKAVIISYTTFMVLLVISVVRYSTVIDWGAIQIWLFWAYWLTAVAAFGYGWFVERVKQ